MSPYGQNYMHAKGCRQLQLIRLTNPWHTYVYSTQKLRYTKTRTITTSYLSPIPRSVTRPTNTVTQAFFAMESIQSITDRLLLTICCGILQASIKYIIIERQVCHYECVYDQATHSDVNMQTTKRQQFLKNDQLIKQDSKLQ